MKQDLCPFVRYHTLLVIPAASWGGWHHCWRKTIVFSLRERIGAPLPCTPMAHSCAMFWLWLFSSVCKKSPGSPIFLLQCQPGLSAWWPTLGAETRFLSSPCLTENGSWPHAEGGKGSQKSCLQEIIMCLFFAWCWRKTLLEIYIHLFCKSLLSATHRESAR